MLAFCFGSFSSTPSAKREGKVVGCKSKARKRKKDQARSRGFVLHRSFEVPTFVFKPRFLHESFSILNLVSNGLSFSLIAITVYEIWPVYWNRAVCDVIILSIFLSMIETSNEKKFNYRIVPNCPEYLQFKFNDFWMSSSRDMLA